MAEALGLASAIASLVTLVGQVTKLSYVFISDVKRASKSQKLYLQETSALTEVLLRMEQALEVQELVAVRTPLISKKAVLECEELLMSLKTALEKATGSSNRIEKLTSSLRWPFEEKEVKTQVEMLRRYRDMFVAALSSDIFMVSVATYRMVDDLSQEKDYQRILEWLGNPNHSRSSTAIFDSASSGTGQWFLAHEEYLKWRDSNVFFLWCYGKPGVGKTVITSIVLNDLNDISESQTPSVIYHFCDFTQRKAETALVVLRSLLRQILQEADSEQLLLLEQRRKKWNNPSLRELSQTFLDITRIKSNTYLIIDALDEFEDRKALMPILREVSQAGIKVLVTSRDIPDIRDALQTERCLEIQAFRSDLEAFVETKLQESDHYESLSSSSNIVSAIVDQASGMFLLAQLLMKHLLSLTSIKQIRQALKSLPSNLSEAYESSLERILDQSPSRANLATRIIGWVVHAERRLKIEELRHALAVEDDANEIDEENLTSAKIIQQVCVGLISIDITDGTLGMIHVTAYDYFRDLKERFAEIQLDIAKTSMTYLSFHPLSDGVCNNFESLKGRFRDVPFLAYAAEYWGNHACQVERETSNRILGILADPDIRASSFQALQYRELKDPKLAAATFNSLPTGLEPLHVAAYWNLTLTAESFLKTGTSATIPDAQGWTPLHWACSQGCEETMELLLKYNVDIDARDHSGWTPLFWATTKGHKKIVSRLLQEKADYFLIDVNGWTALQWAASKGDAAIISILLNHHSKFKANEKKIKIWVKDATVEQAKQLYQPPKYNSKAPLEIAADRQDLHTFDTILNELAAEGSTKDFNEPWEQKGFDEPCVSVPWRIMSKMDHFDRKGLRRWNINEKERSSDVWKSKLLHGAIRDGKVLVVKLLIELGVDLKEYHHGRTALQQAALLKSPEIIETLLAHGANIPGPIEEEDEDERGRGRGPESHQSLHLAIAHGFERTAEALLRGGVNVNSRSAGGVTPLMTACGISPRPEDALLESLPKNMIKMLIDCGADVHATDKNGRNALHWALENRNIDGRLIKLLLESGIDANLRDSRGFTALHHFCGAFRNSKRADPDVEETFKLLISYSTPGAENLEVRRKDRSGDGETVDSPLSIALESENWPAFALLSAKSAILNTTQSPDDLLWRAAYRWALQPKAVEMLLARGASATKLRSNSIPMGHSAIEGLFNDAASSVSPLEDFKSILKMYMDAGLDINAANADNQTLLHIAVTCAKEPDEAAVTQHLLDVGSNIYQPANNTPWDAFLLAAVHGKLSALRVLFTHASNHHNPSHWLKLPSPYSPDPTTSPLPLLCSSLSNASLIDIPSLARYAQNHPPLQTAISLHNTPTATALLAHGASISGADAYGWTPLHTATYNKDEAMVSLLLSSGAAVNAASTQWSHAALARPSGLAGANDWAGTPLHLASLFGNPDIVKILLDAGADVNASTGCRVSNYTRGHGPTPLHMALDTEKVYFNRVPLGRDMLRVAEMLVERGAGVEGVADHIGMRDVLKFEGREGLWEALREGMTQGKGGSVEVVERGGMRVLVGGEFE